MDLIIGLEAAGVALALPSLLAGGAGWPVVFAGLGLIGLEMGLCHTTAFYQYGLMVNDIIHALNVIELVDCF